LTIFRFDRSFPDTFETFFLAQSAGLMRDYSPKIEDRKKGALFTLIASRLKLTKQVVCADSKFKVLQATL